MKISESKMTDKEPAHILVKKDNSQVP